MVGICDKFVWVLDSLYSCFHTQPQLLLSPSSAGEADVGGVRATPVLLLSSWCPSGSSRDTFSAKFSLLKCFCHEFFFTLTSSFLLISSMIWAGHISLYSLLVSWDSWKSFYLRYLPQFNKSVLFSLLPWYVIFLWNFVFRILTLPRNSLW